MWFVGWLVDVQECDEERSYRLCRQKKVWGTMVSADADGVGEAAAAALRLSEEEVCRVICIMLRSSRTASNSKSSKRIMNKECERRL